jgi:uncharacterized protein YceK
MKRLAAVLLLALALTGCGTVRALAGPDPALVAVAPTIQQALANDSAAHPENKPKNDAAGTALDNNVNPPPIIPPEGISALFTTAPGLGAITAVAGLIALVLRQRQQTKIVSEAVAQHADLIDSVTADSADDAKKV